MNTTSQVKALLSLTGHKQGDLMEALDMKSKQSLSNKFVKNRWSAEDLIAVAEVTGCELAFSLPDGQKISLK